MAYEVIMPYHLHMPSYFLETFTEYPFINGGLPPKGKMNLKSFTPFGGSKISLG